MRCLHCNKKLSLLKLAKGDSFCSAEHFDAYQLKLSKDAIDRLMSVPAEESPKAPLLAKPIESNEIAIAPPPLPDESADPPPPYAPFASSPLPPYTLSLSTPITNASEAGESVEPARELTLPVHEVDDTTCMLNLYLQLGLAGTEPKNWTSERQHVIAPEYFRLDINQPPLKFSPEFPEIESLASVETSTSEETEPLVEFSHETVTEESEPPVTLPENLAPADHAIPIEALAPQEADPVVEALPCAVESIIPEHVPLALTEANAPLLLEALAPATFEAIEPEIANPGAEGQPFDEVVPSIALLMPVEPASLAPIEPARPRIPFLMASSFHGRTGSPILIHNAASALPNGVALPPVLENGSLPHFAPCGSIPNFTNFAGPTAIHLHDSTAYWIVGASELAIQQDCVLPNVKRQDSGDAWSPSDRRVVAERPVFDANWTALRPLDFGLPEPASLLSRPDAPRLRKVDPQKLLAGTSLDLVSLFLSVLETPPLGQEPLIVDLPPDATESRWRTSLAPAPNPEALPVAWQHRITHFSLPDPIIDRPEKPMPPHAPFEYASGTIKMSGAEVAGLPAPYIATDRYRQTGWRGTNSAFVTVNAAPCSVFIGSRTLLKAAPVPPGRLKTGSGAPALRWEPHPETPLVPPPSKFLPIRNGTVLPSAKSWPHLEAVPR